MSDSAASHPEIESGYESSSSARPDMPTPPMPTKWMRESFRNLTRLLPRREDKRSTIRRVASGRDRLRAAFPIAASRPGDDRSALDLGGDPPVRLGPPARRPRRRPLPSAAHWPPDGRAWRRRKERGWRAVPAAHELGDRERSGPANDEIGSLRTASRSPERTPRQRRPGRISESIAHGARAPSPRSARQLEFPPPGERRADRPAPGSARASPGSRRRRRRGARGARLERRHGEEFRNGRDCRSRRRARRTAQRPIRSRQRPRPANRAAMRFATPGTEFCS